jgi:Zierdtviridae DNA helicase
MSSINIEKRGRRIEVRSKYPLPGFRAAFPGAYETTAGIWTVPLNLETCKLLREKYGTQLKIGNELARWAKGVREHRNSMAELAAASDAELRILPKVAPKLAKAMKRRKYQRVAARFIADNTATLVADDPGLGKTLEILGGILEAEVAGPYLVIAPKTAAKVVWAREIERWLPPEHRVITMPETRIARDRALRLKRFTPFTWLVVHPEMVLTRTLLRCAACGKVSEQRNKQRRKLTACGHLKDRKTIKYDEHTYPKLFEIEWGAVVIDESHESLIRRSGSVTQRRNGMDKLKVRQGGLRIAASGTPMNSKPHHLWGTLNWLDPQQYSAFYRWAELYWQRSGYNNYEIGDFRKEREHLLWDSLNSVAIRRTKLEVAQDLPPKMEIGSKLDPHDEDSPTGIWLEMEPAQARAYDQMREQSASELESGRLEALTALAELTRLKQLACSYGDIITKKIRYDDGEIGYKQKFIPALPSNKYTWLINALEEWGYPDNPITKVAVVSNFTSLLEVFGTQMTQHFKVKPAAPLVSYITGKVSNRQREQTINRFNTSDHEHVIMLNVKAGGTAITLDTADRMVFLSETRIPDQQLQAEDRIHRVSNPRQCMYYYLRSLGTVDVGTAQINKELIKGSHRLLDARRGVEYLRQVMELSGG